MTTRKVKDKKGEEKLRKEETEGRFRYVKTVNDSKILWMFLLVLFLLYIVFKEVLLAAATALLICIIVMLEIWV
ncbi:MAG: hypothetical protein KAT35_05305, partial [Candidatus Aenigmarchaeota archaeon]|nr:hypothetical protein [Candidatus Aenigmarchaeota archaeon]